MMHIYCEMCTRVTKDEKDLAEHISNQHGLSMYVICVTKENCKISKQNLFQIRTLRLSIFLSVCNVLLSNNASTIVNSMAATVISKTFRA